MCHGKLICAMDKNCAIDIIYVKYTINNETYKMVELTIAGGHQ